MGREDTNHSSNLITMRLIYYKKNSFKTKKTPEDILRIFSDIINNPSKNAETEKLLLNDWYVRMNFKDNRFSIAIGRNAPWYEKSGMGSVLKGKIRQKRITETTNISMIIRPSYQYVFSLGLIFFFITVVLFYAILNNVKPLLILSSILLFAWYFGFLIDFNWQAKAYRRIIGNCFN